MGQVPDYKAIADVSRTLQAFLKSGFVGDLQNVEVEIHDLQGEIQTNPARVTLFLFEVLEDPNTRNRPRVREPENGRVNIKKPLLTLLLRYLLTPWSGSRETDHMILGRITQLFYDLSIIGGNSLQGTSLAGTAETLKMRMAPLTLEERTRVWNAVDKPYRLSVTYEVRVVNIEPSQVVSTPRVSNREVQYGYASEAL